MIALDKEAIPAEAGLPMPLFTTDFDVFAVRGAVERVNRYAIPVFAGEGMRKGQVFPHLTVLGDENGCLRNPFVLVGASLHRNGVEVPGVSAKLYDNVVRVVRIGLFQVRDPAGWSSGLFGIESASKLCIALA